MASVLAWVALVVVVGVHTVVAAVGTRLFRVRLASRWGPPVFVAAVVPVLLVISTMILSGVLGLGPDLGDPGTVLFVLVVLPTVLGATVDYVWMPPPDDGESPGNV